MVFTSAVIVLYLGIRGILQVWIPRGSITIKKCRVALGVLWLPLGSLVYLNELIYFISIWYPASWALAPMPVYLFLTWVAFLVTDTLYQFQVLSNIPESDT